MNFCAISFKLNAISAGFQIFNLFVSISANRRKKLGSRATDSLLGFVGD